MKKKSIRLVATISAVAAFLAAPLLTDSVFAEESRLNYTTGVSGNAGVSSPFTRVKEKQTQKVLGAKDPSAQTSYDLEEVAEQAYAFEGIPYAFGGTSPEAFDYSGFTFYVYKEAGIDLPRTAVAQYNATEKISQTNAQPGDLIFFNQTGRVDHVGIYLGEDEFISAQADAGVVVSSFAEGYWTNHIVGFGRAQ